MKKLYRVVEKEAWTEAKKTGKVPRCNADQKADHVHLNTREWVEYVAGVFFEPFEEPVVLEVDTSDFEKSIKWYPSTDEKPWEQPCAKIDNISLNAVVKKYDLEHSPSDGKNQYKLID